MRPRHFTIAAAVILWALAIVLADRLADIHRGFANVVLGAAVCATIAAMRERCGHPGLDRRLRRTEAAIGALYEGIARAAAAGQRAPHGLDAEAPTMPMLRVIG